MEVAASPPLTTGRSVDIELSGQEVITIDLDNLDPNPEDVLDLLKEGRCQVWVWTKLAGEYWRRGYLGAAEKIAQQAVDCEFARFSLTAVSYLFGQHSQRIMKPRRYLPYMHCSQTFRLPMRGKHPS
jgi:hypothetical protein